MDFTHLPACVLCPAPDPKARRRKLSTYGVWVCTVHYDGAEDGWARHFEEKILAQLRAEGKPAPPRMKNKLLPRTLGDEVTADGKIVRTVNDMSGGGT